MLLFMKGFSLLFPNLKVGFLFFQEKPAFIPDRPKDKRFSDPAEFVRNVMGSSAGAGSGEFHVYRHIRRREYARQEFLQNCKEKVLIHHELPHNLCE